MDAEGGRRVAGTARFAEVVADGSGRGEEDHGKVTAGRRQGGVVGDEAFGHGGQFVVGGRHGDAGEITTLAEAAQVVGEAEGTMLEGSAEVRDRGAPDEAGVVQGETGFGLREETAVEVGEGRRLRCHGVLTLRAMMPLGPPSID